MARWTTEFDCGYKTNWWYIIKDQPFDVNSLKAKRRYEINRGKKNFDVRLIDPTLYKEQLYHVQIAAFSAYPRKYRPSVDKGTFEKDIDFMVLKTDPEFEKRSVNAAIVEKILEHYSEFLNTGGIISDGSRCISHETHFQDYLEKYFGFRKAYCHLHIKYNPKIEWIVKLLYPIRSIVKIFDNNNAIHNVSSVLKMEEIFRQQI